VPAPVVTIDAPDQLPDIAPGGSVQIDVTLTNHGLIAANDVHLELPTRSDLVFTALSTDLGTLAAQSSITVPVTVYRNPPATPAAASLASVGSETDDLPQTDGCTAFLGTYYTYECGPNWVMGRDGRQIDVDINGCLATAVVEQYLDFINQFVPNLYNSDPAPQGNSGPQSGTVIIVDPPEVPQISEVSCNPCFEQIISYYVGCPLGFVEAPVLTVINAIECISTGYGLLFGSTPSTFNNVASAIGCLGETAGLVSNVSNCIQSLVELVQCTYNNPPPASPSAVPLASTTSTGSQIVADVNRLQVDQQLLQDLIGPLRTVLGDDSWIATPADGTDQGQVLSDWLTHFFELTQDSNAAAMPIGDAVRAQLLALPRPTTVSLDQANQFIDRWNRTIAYWSQGIFSADQVPIGQSRDFIDQDLLNAKLAAAAQVGQRSLSLNGIESPAEDIQNTFTDLYTLVSGQQGTCAQVVMRLDQSAVLTRSAFKGTLEVTNGNGTTPITNVQVALKITDAAGNDVTSKFGVTSPDLAGLSGVDGQGVIAAGGTGSATYTIVPSRDAAPVTATTYFVGGTLSYTDPDTGLWITHPLASAAITVNPDPRLTLDYFMQRDVIGDDPFTPDVEPSQPFDLGLIVSNSGHGTAQNFSITSAQPKIVENQKGLLIDFQILSSQVGDSSAAPSLTLNMGDIGPGQTQTGLWHLTSSLQGRFVDFNASFQQTNNFGNPLTSVIDAVNVHELIHTVLDDDPGADEKPDFLVNDIPDDDSLPDTLYMSDGTRFVVNMGVGAAVDHAVTLNARTVHLTATTASGWSYLQLPDPGPGYKLLSVTRSDGKQLRIGDNVWQTTKVFAEGSQAYLDSPRLHLLDDNSTGDYTLVYVLDDSIPPQLLGIDPVSPDPRLTALDAVNVHISEPIDLTTFDWHDVTLSRNGQSVPLSASITIAAVAGSPSTYTIAGLTSFTSDDGAYQLTVNGTGMQDFGANDGQGVISINWTKGLAPPYISALGPVSPSPRSSSVDSIDVTFSKPIDLATFGGDDLSMTRDGVGVPVPSGITVELLGDSTYRIHGLATANMIDGNYSLTVNGTTVDDSDGTPGLASQSVSWTVDTTPPQIAAVQSLSNNPRNTVPLKFDVFFSEPVDLYTLDRSDVTLTRNGMPVALDDRVLVQAVAGGHYQILGLNWFTGAEGTYSLTVAGNHVSDLAGNAGVGTASTTWVMDTTAPTAPGGIGLAVDRGVSATDGLTNSSSITVIGAVAESGLLIHVIDTTLGNDLGYFNAGATGFSAAISLSAGVHHLQIYAVDAAGNVSTAVNYDVIIDTTPPIVTLLAPVTSPRSTAVESEMITFSEAIDPSSFNANALNLNASGSTLNLGESSITISPVDSSNRSFLISGLSGFNSAIGAYALSIDASQLRDLAGNLGIGISTVTWTEVPLTDMLAPTSSVTSLPGEILPDPVDVHSTLIPLQWSGRDNPGGSGIADFNIYVSDNGGPFMLWLSHAQTESAVYQGMDHHTYQFFSQATDHAGNVEALHGTADAAVSVSLGEIHGRIFEDTDDSGTNLPGAPGLSGWTVFLDLNSDGTLDPGEPTAVSDSSGNFSFSGIEAGTYHVAEVVLPGWTRSYYAASGTITAGEVLEGADFGNFRRGVITGTVYADTDRDGLLDHAESGLPNWTVTLHDKLRGVDQTTTTDSQGSYRFSEIDAGSYSLSVSLLPGYILTQAATPFGAPFTVSSRFDMSDANFGIHTEVTAPETSVTSAEANSSGLFTISAVGRDAGGSGLSWFDVYLQIDAGSAQLIAHLPAGTATDGNYSATAFYQTQFDGATHLYRFYSVGTDGAGNMEPPPQGSADIVTITSPGIIRGISYIDLNGNGQRDAGEPGLGGMQIYLDLNGDGVWQEDEPETESNTDPAAGPIGGYEFAGLMPGVNYIVAEVGSPSWEQTAPSGSVQSEAGWLSGDYSVSLGYGQAASGIDFGNRSRDVIPPIITDSLPHVLLSGNGSYQTTDNILLEFSKPVDDSDAVLLSNYVLQAAGADGVWGTADDATIALRPNHAPGSNQVSLAVPSGGLPAGMYRLTVHADHLHDLVGNALDGDGDGAAGGDFVREFALLPPVARAGGYYTVVKGSSVVLTGSASQGDITTYAWDLDGSGQFLTQGVSVSFAAITSGSHKVRLRVSGPLGTSYDDAIVVVSGAQRIADSQNGSLIDLLWNGTSGADHVRFDQLDATTVRVSEWPVDGLGDPTVSTFTGVTGRVIAEGGLGDDLIDARGLSNIPATLDGGGGNNTLYGGQAGDVLIGGINGGEGQQGSNTIIAGNGTNTIYGNGQTGAEGETGGNNLIVGGSGNDTIYGNFGPGGDGGEGGQNLIVGGGGRDSLYSSQPSNTDHGGHGSILIAGRTTLDLTQLRSVLAEWTSADAIEEKIAAINGTTRVGRNGDNYLQLGTTVFDDSDVDSLYSDENGELNWLFYDLAEDVVRRKKASDWTTALT